MIKVSREKELNDSLNQLTGVLKNQHLRQDFIRRKHDIELLKKEKAELQARLQEMEHAISIAPKGTPKHQS